MHGYKRSIARRIARERIALLFDLAEKRMKEGEVDLAKRYVELMLNLSRKYNVRIPKEMKYRICKNCNSYLVPGKNARVRLRKHRIIVTCLSCGNVKRYVYND